MKKINLLIAIIFIIQGCTPNAPTVESENIKIGFEMEEKIKLIYMEAAKMVSL